MREPIPRSWSIAALGVAARAVRAAPRMPRRWRSTPAITPYAKVGGVSGNLSSVGSDTLNNVMTLWAESFKKQYPNVKIQIEGKGSSTAPPALIAGTAQLGPMSREMKPTRDRRVREEVRLPADQGPGRHRRAGGLRQQGQPAQAAHAAAGRRDLLQEAAACGGTAGHHHLGRARPAAAAGRRSRSASTAATRPPAPTASSRSTRCATATTRTPSRSSPGSASVVQGVTEDKYGIGYSGIGYKTSGVKTLALAAQGRRPVRRDRSDEGLRRQVSAGAFPLRLREPAAQQAARSAGEAVSASTS